MPASVRNGILKIIIGMGLMIALIAYPDAAVSGVQRALLQWYRSVAPSLFPFMALMPLLTCMDSIHVYEKMLGKPVGRLLRLPGSAAPAYIIGMIAGSPAGCIAARQIACRAGMNRGQLKRIVFSIIGFSPAFLITGIGASIFGNIEAGVMLLRGQVASQLIMSLILKRAYAKEIDRVSPAESGNDNQGIVAAVGGILKVAGFMALFGSFSAVAGEIFGGKAGLIASGILEITAGAHAVQSLDMDFQYKMILLAGMCGFGGVAICAQNMSALAGCGINAMEFCRHRLFASVISMGIMALQVGLNVNMRINMPARPIVFASIAVIFLAIPIIIRINNTFLNNSICETGMEKMDENA